MTSSNGLGIDGSGRPIVFFIQFVEVAPFTRVPVGFVSAWNALEGAWVELGDAVPIQPDATLAGGAVMGRAEGGRPALGVLGATPAGRLLLAITQWEATRTWSPLSVSLPMLTGRLVSVNDIVFDAADPRVLVGFDQRAAPGSAPESFLYAYRTSSGWSDAFGGAFGPSDAGEASFGPIAAVGEDGEVVAGAATGPFGGQPSLRMVRSLPASGEWEDLGRLGTNVRASQVAIAPDGEAHVVWEEYPSFVGLPRGSTLPVARYDAEAARFRSVGTPLQPDPDFLALGPEIGSDSRGNPVVSWAENRDPVELRSPTVVRQNEGNLVQVAHWNPVESTWHLLPSPAEALEGRGVRPAPLVVLEDDRVLVLVSDGPLAGREDTGPARVRAFRTVQPLAAR